MRKLYIFGLIGLAVLIAAIAWAEQITFSTYYPAPHGVYNNFATNKLAVDVTGVGVPSEFTAMTNGDAHIGRSLIVGAGGGSGFAFDEGATTQDGDVLIKGDVGIGTLTPGTNKLEVDGGPIKATGGLIIHTVPNAATETAMTKVDGQMWLRTDIP